AEIIEFSELGQFIDQPVKTYSSGMKSRLGLAISVHIDPEILIIDEALSDGDKEIAEITCNSMQEFTKLGKTLILVSDSLGKMKKIKKLRKTMCFVSHSIGQMKKFCEKVLWLEFGLVKDFGTVGEVIPKYEKFLREWQRMSKEEKEMYKDNALLQEGRGLNLV